MKRATAHRLDVHKALVALVSADAQGHGLLAGRNGGAARRRLTHESRFVIELHGGAWREKNLKSRMREAHRLRRRPHSPSNMTGYGAVLEFKFLTRRIAFMQSMTRCRRARRAIFGGAAQMGNPLQAPHPGPLPARGEGARPPAFAHAKLTRPWSRNRRRLIRRPRKRSVGPGRPRPE